MLVAPLLLFALSLDVPQVGIQGNEVWLTRDGESRQVTHDGRLKAEVGLSPVGDRIAYYEMCADAQPCIPEVVVLDLSGNRVTHFQVRSGLLLDDGPCMSLEDLTWIAGGKRVAVSCHLNPSLAEYVELDLATGKNVRALLGIWFTPSPDGSRVAHVGSIVHFAPPWAQSYYLMLDDVVVYPLPRGAKPTRDRAYDVRQVGRRHIGVHEFMPAFAWSPGGKRVAVIDCVRDWIESENHNEDGYGEPVNNRCSVVAVSPNGSHTAFPLQGVRADGRITWTSETTLLYEYQGGQRTFRIPAPARRPR